LTAKKTGLKMFSKFKAVISVIHRNKWIHFETKDMEQHLQGHTSRYIYLYNE